MQVFVYYYFVKYLSLLISNYLIVCHSIIVIIAIFTTIILCQKWDITQCWFNVKTFYCNYRTAVSEEFELCIPVQPEWVLILP